MKKIKQESRQTADSVNLYSAMKFQRGGIYSKVLFKSKKADLTMMCIAKKEGLDTHTSTKQGVVQVLKGKGEFLLYNKKICLKPGVLIFMPKNAPHSLKSDSDLAILLTLFAEKLSE